MTNSKIVFSIVR